MQSSAIQNPAWETAFFGMSPVAIGLSLWLALIVLLLILYSIRHYVFTLNRLFAPQRHPYLDIVCAEWPSVTVFIAAHNEEAVIAGAINALLKVNYPQNKLTIMPVNDRSTDGTREIIDDICQRNPGRIIPFHRTSGKPGKAAALKDATALVESEIIVVFDADYLPSPQLIKQLVSPFFDPEVGASMGRVVPQNVGRNLLTRILDLERSGGYQVDQQARMNLGLIPQYGGTVGGIRVKALQHAGGWHDDVLAEDTDLTFRLLLNNWKVVYQNRAECYEEVPEDWGVRVRQISRWAKGHHQAFFRHLFPYMSKRGSHWIEKMDGVALLGIYAMAPMLLLGWIISLVLYFYYPNNLVSFFIGLVAFMSFNTLGNFAAFFQIASATYLDGNRQRIKILPLNFLGFLVSALAISKASLEHIIDSYLKREIKWDKTKRFRLSRQ